MFGIIIRTLGCRHFIRSEVETFHQSNVFKAKFPSHSVNFWEFSGAKTKDVSAYSLFLIFCTVISSPKKVNGTNSRFQKSKKVVISQQDINTDSEVSDLPCESWGPCDFQWVHQKNCIILHEQIRKSFIMGIQNQQNILTDRKWMIDRQILWNFLCGRWFLKSKHCLIMRYQFPHHFFSESFTFTTGAVNFCAFIGTETENLFNF